MTWQILQGDALTELAKLPDRSVQCCVTSPPYYGLRDYGVDGQIGLEPTMDAYIEALVLVFREVRRVLKNDGTLWLNLGDSYANTTTGGQGLNGGRETSTLASQMPPMGTTPTKKHMPDFLKPKNLMGIPWRVAFALQDDGWWLRSDIIWEKPNCIPESVTDRPTRSHEYVFLLTKSQRYFFDQEAVREPHKEVSLQRAQRNRFGGKYKETERQEHSSIKAGKAYGPDGDPDIICSPGGRNIRTVWTIPTQGYDQAHFATFPPALAERCIKAGSAAGDTILDPFAGACTSLLVADRLGRNALGIELNPAYIALARQRIYQDAPLFSQEVK